MDGEIWHHSSVKLLADGMPREQSLVHGAIGCFVGVDQSGITHQSAELAFSRSKDELLYIKTVSSGSQRRTFAFLLTRKLAAIAPSSQHGHAPYHHYSRVTGPTERSQLLHEHQRLLPNSSCNQYLCRVVSAAKVLARQVSIIYDKRLNFCWL